MRNPFHRSEAFETKRQPTEWMDSFQFTTHRSLDTQLCQHHPPQTWSKEDFKREINAFLDQFDDGTRINIREGHDWEPTGLGTQRRAVRTFIEIRAAAALEGAPACRCANLGQVNWAAIPSAGIGPLVNKHTRKYER